MRLVSACSNRVLTFAAPSFAACTASSTLRLIGRKAPSTTRETECADAVALFDTQPGDPISLGQPTRIVLPRQSCSFRASATYPALWSVLMFRDMGDALNFAQNSPSLPCSRPAAGLGHWPQWPAGGGCGANECRMVYVSVVWAAHLGFEGKPEERSHSGGSLSWTIPTHKVPVTTLTTERVVGSLPFMQFLMALDSLRRMQIDMPKVFQAAERPRCAAFFFLSGAFALGFKFRDERCKAS